MKTKFYLALIALLFSLTAITANAASTSKDIISSTSVNMTEEQKNARIEEMKDRVMEIKKMDRSSLSSQDKKDLRKELKGMNKEAKELGNGGVYFSLAGILIVVLVLILIL